MPKRCYSTTWPPGPAPDDNPVDELSREEFDACYAAAEPLVEALYAALDAYAAQRAERPSLIEVFMAADILRFGLRADLREAEADA